MKHMPEPLQDSDEHAACLSAFLDGEAAAAEGACARWRDDAAARRAWHAYHLIGDVMRSDELATLPSRDAAFLAGLRVRLAAEPVVLVPTPVPAPTPVGSRRRPSWLMPVAAAAGFVVVAGVLVATRSAAPGAGTEADVGPVRLAAEAPLQSATPVPGQRASAVRASERQPAPAAYPTSDSALIRDARLDEYLRAHQAAGGLAVATPGGWLRRVDAVVVQPPER